MSDIHDPPPSSVSETTVSLFSQLLKWMKKENDLQLIQHQLNKELVDILTTYLEERLRSVPSHRRGPLRERSFNGSPDIGVDCHDDTRPRLQQVVDDRSQLSELLKSALRSADVLWADEDCVTLYCKRNGEEIALGQTSCQMARQLELGDSVEKLPPAILDHYSGGIEKRIHPAAVTLSEEEDPATWIRSEESRTRSDDGLLHGSRLEKLTQSRADAENADVESTKNPTHSASARASDENFNVISVLEVPPKLDWFRRGRFGALRLRWLPQRSRAERAGDIQLEKEDAEQFVSEWSRDNENFQLFAQTCAEDFSEEKSTRLEERGNQATDSSPPVSICGSPGRDEFSDNFTFLEAEIEDQPEPSENDPKCGADRVVPEEQIDRDDIREPSEILRCSRDLDDLSPPPWDFVTFPSQEDRSVENGSESSYEGPLRSSAAVAERDTCEKPREEGRSSALPRIAMLFPPLPTLDPKGLEKSRIEAEAEKPEFVAFEAGMEEALAESPKPDFVTQSLKSEVDDVEVRVGPKKSKTAFLAVPRSVLLRPVLTSLRSSGRYRRSPPGDDSGYSDSRVSSPRIITVDNALFKEATVYDEDLARAGSGEQIDLQILSVDPERPAVLAWIWANPEPGTKIPSEVLRLSEALARVYDGCEKRERQVVFGQPVAVKDTEGRWVRGRVISSGRTMVTVYLVDMGRQIVKPMDEVCPLDAAFLDAKPLAWRAEIAGINPLSYTRNVAEELELLLAKNRRVVGNVTMLDPVVVRLVDETSFCRSVEIATLLHGKLLSKQGRNVEMGVVVHVPGESDLQLEGEPDLVIVSLNNMAELEKTHWRVQDDAFKKRTLLDYSYRGNFAVEHRNVFYRAFFLKTVENGEAAIELTDYGQRFYAETSRLFTLSHESEMIPHVRTDCWLESFPKNPRKVDTFRARLRELRQKVVIYEKVSCEDENVWGIRLWNQSMMEFGGETEYLLPKIPARLLRYSAQYRTNQMLMIHVKQTWMTGGTTFAAAFLGSHDRTLNYTLGNQGTSDDLHEAMQYDCCELSPFTEYPGQNLFVAAYSGDKPWSRAEPLMWEVAPKPLRSTLLTTPSSKKSR